MVVRMLYACSPICCLKELGSFRLLVFYLLEINLSFYLLNKNQYYYWWQPRSFKSSIAKMTILSSSPSSTSRTACYLRCVSLKMSTVCVHPHNEQTNLTEPSIAFRTRDKFDHRWYIAPHHVQIRSYSTCIFSLMVMQTWNDVIVMS